MAARQLNNGLRTNLAIAIAVLWAIGYLASIATGNGMTVATATPVMLLAAAYLLKDKP